MERVVIVSRSSHKVFLGLAVLSLGLAGFGTAIRADGDEPSQAGQARPVVQGGNASKAGDGTTPRTSDAEARAAIVRRHRRGGGDARSRRPGQGAGVRLARARVDRRELATTPGRAGLGPLGRAGDQARRQPRDPPPDHPGGRTAGAGGPGSGSPQDLHGRTRDPGREARPPGRRTGPTSSAFSGRRSAARGRSKLTGRYRSTRRRSRKVKGCRAIPGWRSPGKSVLASSRRKRGWRRFAIRRHGPDRSKQGAGASTSAGLIGILDRGDRDIAGPIFDEERRLLEDLPALNRVSALRSLAVAKGVSTSTARRSPQPRRSIHAPTYASGIRPHCTALAFLGIAEHQVKAGDKAGAATTTRRVLEVVDLIRQDLRSHPLSRSAELLTDAGDIEGASLVLAQRLDPDRRIIILRSGRRGAGRPG